MIDTSVSFPLSIGCKQFFTASGGQPLYKLLKRDRPPLLTREKLRHVHRDNASSKAINAVFSALQSNIVDRALLAYGKRLPETPTHENYYVFPTDGFVSLHNDAICDHTTCGIVEPDIINLGYVINELSVGLSSPKNTEFIIGGIRQYFAIRVADIPRYDELHATVLHLIKS